MFLCRPEFRLAFAEKLRGSDSLTSRKDCEFLQSYVDSDRLTGLRKLCDFFFYQDGDEVRPALVAGYCHGYRFSFDFPVENRRHLADFLEPDAMVFDCELSIRETKTVVRHALLLERAPPDSILPAFREKRLLELDEIPLLLLENRGRNPAHPGEFLTELSSGFQFRLLSIEAPDSLVP